MSNFDVKKRHHVKSCRVSMSQNQTGIPPTKYVLE